MTRLPDELTDLVEEATRLAETASAAASAAAKWQATDLRKLQAAGVQLDLERLRLDLVMLERDIRTFTTLAKGRGAELDDSFRQRLADKLAELEAFRVWHGLERPKPRRWWQVWRRHA